MLEVLATVFGLKIPGDSPFLSLFCIMPVTGLLAVIFGHLARGSSRRSTGRLLEQGITTAGLSLGYLALLASLLFVVIPNLLRSSVNPQVASPAGSLRTINTAAATYATNYARGFHLQLADLAPPKYDTTTASYKPTDEKAAGLIDDVLAAGNKSYYRFSYIAGPADTNGKISTYTVHADPVDPRAKSKTHYFTDQTKVIRFEEDREAYASSPPIPSYL
jgi:hypothetical protein